MLNGFEVYPFSYGRTWPSSFAFGLFESSDRYLPARKPHLFYLSFLRFTFGSEYACLYLYPSSDFLHHLLHLRHFISMPQSLPGGTGIQVFRSANNDLSSIHITYSASRPPATRTKSVVPVDECVWSQTMQVSI